MNTGRKTPALKTVEKALDILDCIVDSAQPLTATEISDKVGLSLSSVYKFLSTMVEKDYLFYDSDNKHYQVSTRIFRLSNNQCGNQKLIQIAFPVMHRLADETQETVHLAVPQGINAVFVEKIDSAHTVGVQTRIGTIARLDCGATPQAIMAYSSPAVFEQLCGCLRQEDHGEERVRELVRLRERIRAEGCVYTVGQMNAGVAAVASPVFNVSGDVVASMAIAAPQSRFTEDKLEGYTVLLKHACREVSRSLGFTPKANTGKYN